MSIAEFQHYGFSGDWTVNDQNGLLGLQKVNKA